MSPFSNFVLESPSSANLNVHVCSRIFSTLSGDIGNCVIINSQKKQKEYEPGMKKTLMFHDDRKGLSHKRFQRDIWGLVIEWEGSVGVFLFSLFEFF
jgi:hypothetical protein